MQKIDENNKWPIVGNENITEFLTRSVVKGDISGSYIFYGLDNLGKTELAFYFARILFCENRKKSALPCNECLSCKRFASIAENIINNETGNISFHSDLYIINKAEDKKNISIEQVREFIRRLSLSSLFGSYKIGIILDAHYLSIDAANALLKTLEEPKEKVVMILLTSNLDALPKTIISRSQILRFKQVKKEIIYDYLLNKHKASRSAAKNLSHLAGGKPGLAVKFLKADFLKEYLTKANKFLQFFSQSANERLLAIDKLIPKNSGQEGVRIAKAELEIWERIIRDLLLAQSGQIDLIDNWILEEEIKKLGNIKINNLLLALKNINLTREYLEANVNPKLALEHVAINI